MSPTLSLLLLTGLAVASPPAVPKAKQPPASSPAAARAENAAGSWLSWRGDAAQTGRAAGSLDVPNLAERWTATASDGFVAGAVVDATRVVAGNKDGHIYAWGRTDGALLWKVAAGAPVEAPPLRSGEVVVVGTRGGKVLALQAATGAPVWTADLGAEITAGAVPVPAHGTLGAGFVVGAYDGRMHRLDAATGASVWTYETGSYLYGSVSVVGNQGTFGGCDGFLHVVDLGTGKALQKIVVEAYVGAAVASEGGHAFVGHFGNQVMAFQPADGAVLWKHQDRSFPYLSSPALTAEAVILGGRDRALHALERATGEPLWWFPTGGKVDSSPVVVGDVVVVGSADGKVHIVKSETGESVRSFDVGGAVTASPAVVNGWVYIGSEDGVFHAFGPTLPSKKERR